MSRPIRLGDDLLARAEGLVQPDETLRGVIEIALDLGLTALEEEAAEARGATVQPPALPGHAWGMPRAAAQA